MTHLTHLPIPLSLHLHHRADISSWHEFIKMATGSNRRRYSQVLVGLPYCIFVHLRPSAFRDFVDSSRDRCSRQSQSQAGVLGSYGRHYRRIRELNLRGEMCCTTADLSSSTPPRRWVA